jgi:hypothetical protein
MKITGTNWARGTIRAFLQVNKGILRQFVTTTTTTKTEARADIFKIKDGLENNLNS